MAQLEMNDLMFRPGLMAGERILITGGGTGLGKVMAEACLMLGAEVYICGRRGGVVEETAAELMTAHGGKCVGLACDIRVPEAIEAMLDQIWADGGALTGLVNNAAGNFISRTEDLSPRGFDAISNIVFRGAFFVTQGCGKRWIAEGRKASVVSILVTWIWNGGPFTVPSAMSKAGIAAMSQSLAVEWGSYGIRFNNIAPGPFPTKGAWDRLMPTDKLASDYTESVPMGRPGENDELANLASFLMADQCRYINGAIIPIDGAQWLNGAGTFARLRELSDQDWTNIRDAIKSANAKDKALRS